MFDSAAALVFCGSSFMTLILRELCARIARIYQNFKRAGQSKWKDRLFC